MCGTFCRRPISSAIGFSELYLTLFQLKVLRYCSNGPITGQSFALQALDHSDAILSLTFLCMMIFSSSPSRTFLRVSPTLATTLLHSPSILPSSSDCCISASSVPTLKSGMLNCEAWPFSDLTALCIAPIASSLWPEGVIDEGSATNKYLA